MNRLFNGGEWTQARFNSFVKSALRSASQRWPPKYKVLNDACIGKHINIKTGRLAKHYKCAACSGNYPAKDVVVDHILPVVPIEGFTSWDVVVDRMYCEADNLQVLCKPCHKIKSSEESLERKKHATTI
ncbi:MAG: HNH endonuclease signature motif containing protein [Flavobacterium sp.]